MANLASSSVTIVRAWTEGHVTGKDRKGALLTIAGAVTAGGTTNLMLASAMGFTKIESCGNFLIYTTATGITLRVVPAMPSLDGTVINTCDVAAAAGAAHMNVADVVIAAAESAQVEVHGYV